MVQCHARGGLGLQEGLGCAAAGHSMLMRCMLCHMASGDRPQQPGQGGVGGDQRVQ
jgi:hypothetical protein